MRERVRIEGERGSVVCDTRHWPIVVIHWRGAVEIGVIEGFGAWLDATFDYAEAESLRFAMISDLTRSEPPSAEARRALVELRDRQMPRTKIHIVRDVVITDRPVIRAAVKALHWIAPQLGVNMVASLDEALSAVYNELEHVGIEAPRLTAIEFEGVD